MRIMPEPPRCIVIASPNGAGKTTFAREYLPKDARVIHFVNADLIAGGLSPLRPELAALAAGRLVLVELDRLAKSKQSFAFETTLSGQSTSVVSNAGKPPATASKSSSFAYFPLRFPSGASQPASAREATTSRPRTFSAVSSAGGRISQNFISRSPTSGRYTKTQG